MGACLGREGKDVTANNGFSEHEPIEENGGLGRLRSGSNTLFPETSLHGSVGENRQICDLLYSENIDVIKEVITRDKIDQLVLRTLSVIRHLVEK